MFIAVGPLATACAYPSTLLIAVRALQSTRHLEHWDRSRLYLPKPLLRHSYGLHIYKYKYIYDLLLYIRCRPPSYSFCNHVRTTFLLYCCCSSIPTSALIPRQFLPKPQPNNSHKARKGREKTRTPLSDPTTNTVDPVQERQLISLSDPGRRQSRHCLMHLCRHCCCCCCCCFCCLSL